MATGYPAGQGHRLDARERFQLGDELTIEFRPAIFRIPCGKQIIGSDQHVVGIETRIDLLRAHEAPDEQPRADQQQQRQRNLRYHQPAREACP